MALSKRRCRHCSEYHDAAGGVKTPSGWYCSHAHAVAFAIAKTEKAKERQLAKAKRQRETQAKEVRKAERQRKMDVKPLSYWHQRARKACHDYIRARDEHLPCISCGCWDTPQWDAGHYRPAGINGSLRYSENNIAKQCVRCNRHLSGSLTAYRIGLVARIGEAAVVELDNNHEIRRYTRAELEEIEGHYKKKLKELKQKRAA